MITIFVLYSVDRLNELVYTLYSLQEMDGIEECQKILCVDGQTNTNPSGYEIIEVKRPDSGLYCWAKMWDVAIGRAKYDKILYLDSDRILPKSFLHTINHTVVDGVFAFPGRLYNVTKSIDYKMLCNLRQDHNKYKSLLSADHRVYSNPFDAVGRKNPMSGCVAFTKKTYDESGGLDYSFQGWGYPDTDYFAKTYEMGCKFKSIDCTELHLHHDYVGGIRKVLLMGLWNGIKFCRKWGYSIHPFLLERSKQLGVKVEVVEKYPSIEAFLASFDKVKIMM